MAANNKKIAIITWYNSGMNYGQTLQAYALQKILKLHGYFVETLTYGFGVCSNNYFLNQYIKYRGISKEKRSVQRQFDKFVKHNMTISVPLHSKGDIEKYLEDKKFDTLICGSDQIWNPYNIDPVYYLAIDGRYNRIAYAVSLIDKQFSDKFLEYPEVEKWIRNLQYVSVRENTGADIVEKISHILPRVVLDPTLLLEPSEWITFVKRRKENEKYVFCYLFDVTETQKKCINAIANKFGIRKILFADILISSEPEIEIIRNMSIEDFLTYIYYADMVITDSFHGMIFSIIFKRTFFVFDNGKEEDSSKYYNIDRMYTLLERINLKSRILDEYTINEKMVDIEINYFDVEKKIEFYRKESVDFLINAVENRK